MNLTEPLDRRRNAQLQVPRRTKTESDGGAPDAHWSESK